MPQISVNEIDQSVVTRVVSDDKVKVLVPIISSFGPGFDNENTSVNTFTDITDFNRMYGYTDAEFNPLENDYSRNYAAQLIQKGAAVSVVRVNNSGLSSVFNIGPSDRSTATQDTVCPANKGNNISQFTQTADTLSELTALSKQNVVPGSITVSCTINQNSYAFSDSPTSETAGTIVITDGTSNIVGTVTYATGAISWTGATTGVSNVKATYSYEDYVKGTFCPQIDSITAKYTGSFGNRLLISISQINTVNLAQSYQYANISVYYATVLPSYSLGDNGTIIDNSTISGATLLETKRVSTNPDDPYYFEDVEFEFIKITAKPGARNELRLIWSNIDAQPSTDVTLYAGFPVIPLKYATPSGMVFNTSAKLSGGTDFNYSPGLLAKLLLGFKGYYSTDDTWTVFDVQQYTKETFGVNGIVNNLYTSISDMYKNFQDPYIYDFDFITSGGFVYNKYDATSIVNTDETIKNVSDETLTIESASTTLQKKGVAPGTVHLTASDVKYVDVQKPDMTTQGTLVKATNDWTVDTTDSTVYGNINYETGVITNISASITTGTASYSWFNGIPTVSPAIPYTTGTDTYSAYYTEVTPIHASMRDLVNTRQDCIALFDVPYDYDKTAIVEYSRMLNTSYGTMHHPWCWVQHPTIANKEIRMAPSYIFLYTFLSNLIDNVDSQKWFPPAGVKRATARVVKRPDYEIGSVILNAWQNDNTSRVNPIMKLKQYNYVIYGQYTTLQAIDLNTHSALESLNVRLISNVCKKKIFDVCLNMAFEPNTSTLWLKFFSQMDEFLRYMQYNEGVYSYKIKMDESTVTTDDINHLRCPGKVWIAPTRTAEFFDIDFIITEAGAIFPEDQ